MPPTATVRIVERHGYLGYQPIDVTSPDGDVELHLAGTRPTVERLRGAIAVARNILRTSIGRRRTPCRRHDFDRRCTTVLWHSITWQYLPADERVRSALNRRISRASRCPLPAPCTSPGLPTSGPAPKSYPSTVAAVGRGGHVPGSWCIHPHGPPDSVHELSAIPAGLTVLAPRQQLAGYFPDQPVGIHASAATVWRARGAGRRGPDVGAHFGLQRLLRMEAIRQSRFHGCVARLLLADSRSAAVMSPCREAAHENELHSLC